MIKNSLPKLVVIQRGNPQNFWEGIHDVSEMVEGVNCRNGLFVPTGEKVNLSEARCLKVFDVWYADPSTCCKTLIPSYTRELLHQAPNLADILVIVPVEWYDNIVTGKIIAGYYTTRPLF